MECCSDVFCSLPQIFASTQSCLWALQAVPLTSWLGVCSDCCTVSCETLCRQWQCVPFQIKSNQLYLPSMDSNLGVEPSQRWSREKGGTWAQLQTSWQRVCILSMFLTNTFDLWATYLHWTALGLGYFKNQGPGLKPPSAPLLIRPCTHTLGFLISLTGNWQWEEHQAKSGAHELKLT